MLNYPIRDFGQVYPRRNETINIDGKIVLIIVIVLILRQTVIGQALLAGFVH